MKMLLAIILGVHLRMRPPGMTEWKYLWRCLVLKFFFRHKTMIATNCGHDYYTVSCDDLRCLTSCRRQKKLKEWEEKDEKLALPKARLL